MRGGVDVRVEGTRLVRLEAVPPVAAKVLPGPAPVLVLIGSAAALLEGDSVSIRVELCGGARLTVISSAATIAHPCPTGGGTLLDVECRLGPGSTLAWLPETVIACRGCHHLSRSRLSLGAGAAAVWLDSCTLGRSGEAPGRFEQRLDVELDGMPLLRDGLAVSERPGWDGPAVLGPARHLAALHLLGVRPPDEIPGVMALAGPGATMRALTARADELGLRLKAALPIFLHALACAREEAPVHVHV